MKNQQDDSGSYRVIRGGHWGNTAGFVRAACRYFYEPGVRSVSFGFRLVIKKEKYYGEQHISRARERVVH